MHPCASSASCTSGATASDVRAQCHRLCLYAAFRRVIEGSEVRDGLPKAVTPSPRGAQRSSPNDSRNGSNRRALTALLEPWVNGSRDGRFPGEAPVATPNKRRAAPAGSKPTAHNGSGVPCSTQFPLRLPLAPQASRNTYPTDHTIGIELERLDQRGAIFERTRIMRSTEDHVASPLRFQA